MVRVEETYQRLPVPLQHLAVSLKGMELKYRRGSPALMDEEFERLRRSERWSAEEFLEYQRQRIVQLVRQAYEQVPYYRESWKELGVGSSDVKTIDDFRKLPELKKEVVRNGPLRLVNERTPRHRLRKGHRSGSTGNPIQHYATREAFWREWALISRLRYWSRISDPHFPRRAQFTGRDVFGASANQPYRINLWGNALVLVDDPHLGKSGPLLHRRSLRVGSGPHRWYPSASLSLVRLANEKCLEVPRLPVTITAAETLDDETRPELAKAFRGRVYNRCSASEPSCFWSDCETGNMHIHPESGYSEIIRDDGAPVEAGEEGKVLDRLLVRIVSDSDFRREVLDRLEADMRREVGEQVQLRFDVVSSIRRGASGKLRTGFFGPPILRDAGVGGPSEYFGSDRRRVPGVAA